MDISMLAMLFLGVWTADHGGRMTLEGDPHSGHFSGYGQGQYSAYRLSCDVFAAGQARCTGQGTRTEDGAVYDGTYTLQVTGEGQMTSVWSVTYRASGEVFTGTSRLTR